MSSRVWIVGPIAWDTVIYLPSMPKPGKFVQAIQTIERPGGTAANAAIAILLISVMPKISIKSGIKADEGVDLKKSIKNSTLR